MQFCVDCLWCGLRQAVCYFILTSSFLTASMPSKFSWLFHSFALMILAIQLWWNLLLHLPNTWRFWWIFIISSHYFSVAIAVIVFDVDFIRQFVTQSSSIWFLPSVLVVCVVFLFIHLLVKFLGLIEASSISKWIRLFQNKF